MAVKYLTSTSGSPQTWTVPNGPVVGTSLAAEGWGAGSGGSGSNTSNRAGGAGAAYAKIPNFYITPDHIASGVPFVVNTGSAGVGGANSVAGTDTTFGVNNLFSNSLMTGAAIGTPGTLPTGWAQQLDMGTASGCAINVVGIGIDGVGYPYIDLSISGSATGFSQAIKVFVDGTSSNGTPAIAPTTTYTFSLYTQAPLNDIVNCIAILDYDSQDASHAYLGTNAGSANISGPLTLTRFSASNASFASAAFAQAYFTVYAGAAGSFSGTWRIAGIQLEAAASASVWCATGTGILPFLTAKGGGATSGTTGGVGGLASACIPTTGAFNGGSGATRTQGGGGGGSAGPLGAGTSTTTGTGGTGNNATVAAGISYTEAGGGATAGAAPTAGGNPGGGGAGNTSTGNGSAGGQGQIRLSWPDVPAEAHHAPVLAKFRPGPGRGPFPLIPPPLRDYSAPGTAAAPNTGSVVFTGLAPSADETVEPGVGSVVFTGNAPSPLVEGIAPRLPRQLGRGPRPLIPQPWRSRDFSSISFAPGAGLITFTGFAPSADETVAPGVGSIVFTGKAPSADEAVLPDVGSIVLAGNAPSLLVEGVAPRLPRQLGRGPRPLIAHPLRDYSPAATAILPAAGSVVFTGFAPSVDENVAPGVGSIVFTGQASTADEAVAPGVGSILFTGQAPSADEAVLPSAGSVLFTGQAPSVDEAVLPGAGSIVFTGNAPTALPDGIAPRLPRQLGRGPRPLIAHPLRDFSPPSATTLFPDSGSVLFTGQAPSVDETLSPGAGSIVLTGQAPSADLFLPVGVGSIVFTGLAPTPVYNVVAAPGVGSMLLTGRVPTVTASAPRVIVAQPQFLW